jgi:hypothetical protein
VSKSRRIPFGLWPANWGLEGKRRELAEAEYYLKGEDLARRKLDLEHEDHETPEFQLAKARLDHKYERISDSEFRKIEATSKGESFIEVLHCELKSTPAGAQLTFELDWNEAFVQELVNEGWTGFSDDDIVNRWFEETCRYMFVQDDLDEPVDPMVTSSTRTRRDPLEGDLAEYS